MPSLGSTKGEPIRNTHSRFSSGFLGGGGECLVNAVAAASSLVFLFGARSHSYFAGALKKDDRVLVQDLGCLTNIHDMRVVREKKYYCYHTSLTVI